MRKYASILLILALAGCSIFQKEHPVIVNPPKSEIFHPPAPAKLNLVPIQPWTVIPKGGTTDKTVYALNTRGYEILSLNLAELRRYIKDLQELLKYYRNLKTIETPTVQPTP